MFLFNHCRETLLPAISKAVDRLQETNRLRFVGLVFTTDLKWSDTSNQQVYLLQGNMRQCVVNPFHFLAFPQSHYSQSFLSYHPCYTLSTNSIPVLPGVKFLLTSTLLLILYPDSIVNFFVFSDFCDTFSLLAIQLSDRLYFLYTHLCNYFIIYLLI